MHATVCPPHLTHDVDLKIMIPMRIVSFCVVGSCALLASCHTKESVKSPDASMVAEADRNSVGLVKVRILDSGGTPLYKTTSGASAYQNWSIQWLSNEKLLLQSSDIGPSTFVKQPDGTWKPGFPLRKLSPNGKLVAYTYYHSADLLALCILSANGDAEEASNVVKEFKTTYSCPDLIDCARWDGNARIIIQCGTKNYLWDLDSSGAWRENKTGEQAADGKPQDAAQPPR